MSERPLSRIATGVPNLDLLLHGGLLAGSTTVIAGPPGSGKTILAQQIAFHAAAEGLDVAFFQTLSEPTAKTLLYLQQFDYFDRALLEARVKFVDLGGILRTKTAAEMRELVMGQLRDLAPAVVVIDSFKIFDDLLESREHVRKFTYEIAVNLMAWECTALLLGEYAPRDYESNPLFSIVDGLVDLSYGEIAGEQQRRLRVVKMRGTSHEREPASFAIDSRGIEVFVPRLLLRPPARPVTLERCKTGIARFDELLGDGIPIGSSLLVSGAAGTGKTALLLECLYRAAASGEVGIYFAFDDGIERLLATARELGWDIDALVSAGLLHFVAVPQPEIHIEHDVTRMHERALAVGAKRIAVDSVSSLLHNLVDPQLVREKVFQISNIAKAAGAVAFLAMDVPYGSDLLSRYGVEETVVDGIIALTLVERGLERQRFVEIYKLRNTAHLSGRHSMTISTGGMSVFPRHAEDATFIPPTPFDVTRRLSLGSAALDELVGGGVLERSVTLVSGSTGIGKSTLAVQFALEGAARGEPTLYIAREEGPKQILASAGELGLPLQQAVDAGLVELFYLSGSGIRAGQLLTLLTDKVQARNVRRLVLDSATRLESDDLGPTELPLLLYSLIMRFKALGVTSLLTLESKSFFRTDTIGDEGLSPVADNLLLLRYANRAGSIVRTVSVMKTRGSNHEDYPRTFRIARGGLQVEAALDSPWAVHDQGAGGTA